MDNQSTAGSEVFPYFEGDSPKAFAMQPIKLRHISYQNQLATLIIQKLYRGHRVRLKLWEFNGVLTVSRAAKIQRVWRGFQGRKKAALVYSIKVLRAAHILHGIYYTWRHKRKRLVAHLKFMNNSMIKFQCQFRRRKATELVRVVRFIKHTKCAIKIQSVVRVLLAKCLVKRRKDRLKRICQHLLRYCRGQLLDSNSQSYTGGDMQYESVLHSISSLDMFLCHLVAAGEYEPALELAAKMGHSNANSSSRAEMSFHSDITTYVVYCSLMALWTRKGKIRAVREDYLEEALGLLQQHHMIKSLESEGTSVIGRQSEGAAGGEGVDVPEWFLDGQTYLVRDKTLVIPPEGAKMTRLGSTYDDVIVLIRQSYFNKRNKNLSREQLLANGRVTPNMRNQYSDEWDALVESYYHCAMPHYHGTSISSYDAMVLFSDCIGYHANYKQLLFGSVPVDVVVDPYQAAGGPHKRKHKAHKLHVMVNRKAEQLRLSQKTDHLLNGQKDLTKHTVIQRTALLSEDVAYQVNEKLTPIVPEAEIRRRFLMLSKRRSKQRMVFLLRRAQDLLSAGSPSLEEIALRLEVFSNLYKDDDECDVLCSLGERAFLFPNQSDDAKAHPEKVFEGVSGATSAAPAAPTAGGGVNGTAVNPPVDPAAELQRQQSVKMTWQMKQKIAKDLHLKQQRELVLRSLQIIHTGNMILIQGSLTLDRLVEKFVPPPKFVEVLPQMPKRRSAAAAEEREKQSTNSNSEDKWREDQVWKDLMARAAAIPVAVRPLLLFHSEIDQLARDHELYEDHISAVDMEVSNVAAADAVYVHVKVIDYNKITRYLVENVQVETAAVHLIPQEIRTLVMQMVQYREMCEAQPVDSALSRLVYTSMKFKLDELESRRTQRNDGRLAEYVTRILQKLYRGFAGRARFRKLKKRKQEKDARLKILAENQERERRIEEHRFNMAKEIQRIMRGRVWRAKLRVMRRCALKIQCRFRVFRAKNIVNQERLRKTAGPQVVPMLANGKGVVVDKRKFILQVYRCGNNYKFEGVDLLEGCMYEGHCHQTEVKEVLRDHNRNITGTTVADDLARINIWQHQRVCDLLVENLGFVTRMTCATNEMGVGKVDTALVLVVNKQAKAGIPNVQKTKEKPVGHFYRDYNKLLVKHPQVMLNSRSVKLIKKPTGK